MTYDEFRRIKEANEASVQPDSGYTKLCAEVEKLIDLYEGARDERGAALLQNHELLAACKAAYTMDHNRPYPVEIIGKLREAIDFCQRGTSEKRKHEEEAGRDGRGK